MSEQDAMRWLDELAIRHRAEATHYGVRTVSVKEAHQLAEACALGAAALRRSTQTCATCKTTVRVLHPNHVERRLMLHCVNVTEVFGRGSVSPTFHRLVPEDFSCKLWTPRSDQP